MPDEPTGDAPTGTDGSGGSSPPQDDVLAENERLKRENAEFREERRSMRADAAAAKHGLDAETASLLKGLDADEIDAKAAAIAAARGTGAPSGDGNGTQPDPAASQPDDSTSAALDTLGQPPAQPPSGDGAPKGLRDQMLAEINNAGSTDEIERIQQKYIALAHEKGDPSLFAM